MSQADALSRFFKGDETEAEDYFTRIKNKFVAMCTYSDDDNDTKSNKPGIIRIPCKTVAVAKQEDLDFNIQVFSDDGMPTKVCSDCRLMFEYSYSFKQMCKRAETLLRQYPLTGKWPKPLQKPTPPNLQTVTKSTSKTILNQNPMQINRTNKNSENNKDEQTKIVVKKLLNADPADSPEPPVPIRIKKEKLEFDALSIMNKIENNDELSIDDVQRFIDSDGFAEETPKPTGKPKLLNKSSIRILNKDVEIDIEPLLSRPQVTRDEDGNVAIVTEILVPSENYEPEDELIKQARPVKTNVFPCPECERSFPLRQLRDIHMANHVRERCFQCPDCDKSFFSKYDLQKHSVIHTGYRPFKCTICDKAFTRATLLYRHEKSHTDVPKHLCVHCERPFLSKEELEKHTERHLKNRPFKCKICNKGFAFKQGKERHEVIHSRVQPNPCQYCDQSFSTPSKLARHLTAHAGSRPYPCKFCSKSYLLSHHLTRHLRSHKQENYVCPICNKAFKKRELLIYHSAVHAIKNLTCSLCEETFATSEEVSLHIKQHADNPTYACVFCDLQFSLNSTLDAHVLEHHAEDMQAYNDDPKSDNKSTENSGSEKEDSNPEFQEAVEYIIDEFPLECSSNEQQNIIKVEPEETEVLNDQPKIVSQIVIQPGQSKKRGANEIRNTKSITNCEEFQYIDSDDPPIEPPRKQPKVTDKKIPVTSKVVRQRNPKTAAAITQQETVNSGNASPKLKQTTLTSVLKVLPKGITIRKAGGSEVSPVATAVPKVVTSPKGAEKTSSPAKSKFTETKQVSKLVKTSPNTRANASPKSMPATNKNSNSPTQQALVEAKTSTGSSPQTDKNAASSPKTNQKPFTEKILPNGKKVRQMVVSKSEAAAMMKAGKVFVQNGNMILKLSPTSSKKEV
ncbi:RE1-silencing transcription factor-like [Teleopsis dalmanni]|uniref:RE1-silencing transcription factor-like n=1 Tax=Teleopsis dalmanni TaxID=139649 RepID=UPI0018CF6D31|nr:RE1-silencing transcription factor-like [Teleopsis dalmanni]